MKHLPKFPPELPFMKSSETVVNSVTRLVGDEAKAIRDYAEAAAYARGRRDIQTADLFEHIRSEEMQHLAELNKRMKEVLYGK